MADRVGREQARLRVAAAGGSAVHLEAGSDDQQQRAANHELDDALAAYRQAVVNGRSVVVAFATSLLS